MVRKKSEQRGDFTRTEGGKIGGEKPGESERRKAERRDIFLYYQERCTEGKAAHRAVMLVQAHENQKRFWVQLTETGTFPQKPVLRHGEGRRQGQDGQQPSPQTPSCFPAATGLCPEGTAKMTAKPFPACSASAELLSGERGQPPAYGSVKPTRSTLVLVAPAGKRGWLGLGLGRPCCPLTPPAPQGGRAIRLCAFLLSLLLAHPTQGGKTCIKKKKK